MAELILERIIPYQSIIWDWNGTLINDAHIAAAAEAEVFKKYGLPAQSPAARLKNFCFPIEKYYEKMGFDFSKYSYEEVSNDWLRFYEELVMKAPLFEGVSEMLTKLKMAGKRQFVLSAAPEDHVSTMLKHHLIRDYFEAVYGLAHAKADSKVERGRELVADFKINMQTAILVGDTAHDCEVAKALGCEVLLIADGHHAYEALCEAHDNVLRTRALVS